MDAIMKFVKVKNILDTSETRNAFNLSWKKPMKFYKEHTVEEAVRTLLIEAYNGR